jgi:hypothetical protein
LATQVAAKMTAYTYDAFLVNQPLDRTQGKKSKELWA